jgi:L-amino acid N-acyltransferase YncA
VDVSDARTVREIYAPFVSDDATSFEAVVPDLAEVERRIQTGRDRYPWLVFESDRKILGYAYASAHRARQAYQWCVEVSVYVHPQAHRGGVGRALYTALFELLPDKVRPGVNGWLVAPADAVALARTIDEALVSRDRLSAMGRRRPRDCRA